MDVDCGSPDGFWPANSDRNVVEIDFPLTPDHTKTAPAKAAAMAAAGIPFPRGVVMSAGKFGLQAGGNLAQDHATRDGADDDTDPKLGRL